MKLTKICIQPLRGPRAARMDTWVNVNSWWNHWVPRDDEIEIHNTLSFIDQFRGSSGSSLGWGLRGIPCLSSFNFRVTLTFSACSSSSLMSSLCVSLTFSIVRMSGCEAESRIMSWYDAFLKKAPVLDVTSILSTLVGRWASVPQFSVEEGAAGFYDWSQKIWK